MQKTSTNSMGHLIAAVVAATVFALSSVWSFQGLHPAVWGDVSVSAGALPPAGIMTAFPALAGRLIYRLLPFGAALRVDVVLARAALAAMAWMMYFSLSGTMHVFVGAGLRDPVRRRAAIRLASLLGAFVFAFSDPVWKLGQALTPVTFGMFLATASFFLLVRFIRYAKITSAVGALAAAGLLSAATPFGLLVAAVGVCAAVLQLRRPPSAAWASFLDMPTQHRVKWSMTLAFLAAFASGALAEMLSFAALGGLRASGAAAANLPRAFFAEYTGALRGVDAVGCVGFAAAALLPLFLASMMLAKATDEYRVLSYRVGIVSLVTSLFAFLQVSPLPFAWFWNIIGPDHMSSPFALSFAALLSSVTLAWGFYVAAVDALCRDYAQLKIIEADFFADDDRAGLSATEARGETVDSVRIGLVRLAVLSIPVAMTAFCAAGRRLSADRELCSVLDEFLRETIEESDGADYIFTDGVLDDGLRLCARSLGSGLAPVSVAGGTSARGAFVRELAGRTDEDRATLRVGGAEALSTWIEQPEKMSTVSLQTAFETLRANGGLRPVVYGALVRPAGGDDARAAESAERCRRLAVRILALCYGPELSGALDSRVRDLALLVQFRLSSLARLRAKSLDSAGQTHMAMGELRLASRLDAANPSLAELQKREGWTRRGGGDALTPREGLAVAMKRADFIMARRYALPILQSSPGDAAANFAVGMSFYVEGLYASAVEYLKRAAEANPGEPVIYNNIAMASLLAGRIDEAATNAAKAVELLPGSSEIRDTIHRIEEAKRKMRPGDTGGEPKETTR